MSRQKETTQGTAAMKLRTSLLKLLASTIITLVSITAMQSESGAIIKWHYVDKVWYSYDTVKIFVDPSQPGKSPKFKYKMLNGKKFYIDILNSRVKSTLSTTIDLDDVHSLRRAQFKPDVSRVVIQFKKNGIKPNVTFVNKSEPYILISWNKKNAVRPTKKYRILIDPGHGGRDTGAIGPVKKTKEKDVTLDIAKKLERHLKQRDNVTVELTRRGDKTMRPSTRKAFARKWKPDIFISIHANSSPQKNSTVNRTEIYFYDRKSQSLAEVVRNELVNELERSKGHIRREPFTVIYKNPATLGSVLVESCYISSKVGENFLRQSWYREEIAKGLTNSIDTYLESLD